MTILSFLSKHKHLKRFLKLPIFRSLRRIYLKRLPASINIPLDISAKTLYDIGVGSINSEAWKFKARYPDIQIIGLEPHPTRYNKLKYVYPGILLNKAVAEKDGILKGYEGYEKADDFVRYPRKEEMKYYRKFEIEAITLDTLDKEFGHPPEIFIWADIEGSELDILKGAKKLLSSGRVVAINLELSWVSPTEGWCKAKDVINFLDKYNFRPNQEISFTGHQDIIFLPK